MEFIEHVWAVETVPSKLDLDFKLRVRVRDRAKSVFSIGKQEQPQVREMQHGIG
jgi:hypothetical protein